MKNRLIGMMILVSICALVVGAQARVLTTTPNPLDGKQTDRAETALGDLVADAVRAAGNVDIALVNASQLRLIDLPAGQITDAQVQSLLAYPDEKLAVVTLKGAKVAACLERGLGILPERNKGFLQVAGLTVRFDSSQPAGSRLVEVRAGRNVLDNDASYKVAMPASLARGAGGYFPIINGAPVKQVDMTLEQAVENYLSAQGTASVQSLNRLVDVNPKAK
jgi:2',3'-cyclic-nucleotide 2'-phosphodiesterase (5'-nucleotidase family)